VGFFWGSGGTAVRHRTVGVGKGGFFLFVFHPLPGGGFLGTLTTGTPNATFPAPSGPLGLAA